MKGYDYDPKTNSPYLRLKSQGEKIKIRLVSEPIIFQEEDLNHKMADRFAWKVIDRADGEIKAYKAGVSVYKAIRDYAMDEDWGDPTGYDLTITRTEEQGRYYAVTASPKKTAITEEEKAKIAEADIDLKKLFKVEENSDDAGAEVEPEPDEEIDINEIPF